MDLARFFFFFGMVRSHNEINMLQRSPIFALNYFAIIWYPALTSSRDQMWEVINVCVIKHNIIIESECASPAIDYQLYDLCGALADVNHHVSAKLDYFLAMHA